MVCGGRGAVKTVPPPITAETIFPVTSDLYLQNVPPPMTPETIFPVTSDLCIDNKSTRLSDTGDITTDHMQLEDNTFDFADYTSGASDVQSMMSLLSAAELGNSKPDGDLSLCFSHRAVTLQS